MDQGHVGRKARRATAPLYKVTLKATRACSAKEDVGRIRGGRAASDET